MVDRACVVLRDVLDPDRLQARLAIADDRRHRCEPREPDERRENAAVLAEDEARPEDDVTKAGRAHRALHLPLRREVRHRVLRPLVEPERAREDESTDPGAFGGRDEIARAVLHDALEVRARSLDDRDEMDDGVHADARSAEHGLVGHVADDELGAPRRQPARAARIPHERAHRHVARAQRVHHVMADEARPAGDEDGHSKFL